MTDVGFWDVIARQSRDSHSLEAVAELIAEIAEFQSAKVQWCALQREMKTREDYRALREVPEP